MEAENPLFLSQQPWSGPILTQDIPCHTSTTQFLIHLVLASHIEATFKCIGSHFGFAATILMHTKLYHVWYLTYHFPLLSYVSPSLPYLIEDTSIFLNKVFQTFLTYMLHICYTLH